MNPDQDVETFLNFSAGHSHIEALEANWEDEFVKAINNLRVDALKESFRRGFAKSLNGQLAPREYESRTGWEFDEAEEFHEHLHALWAKFYGDADPGAELS
jgi:hypothetical protein